MVPNILSLTDLTKPASPLQSQTQCQSCLRLGRETHSLLLNLPDLLLTDSNPGSLLQIMPPLSYRGEGTIHRPNLQDRHSQPRGQGSELLMFQWSRYGPDLLAATMFLQNFPEWRPITAPGAGSSPQQKRKTSHDFHHDHRSCPIDRCPPLALSLGLSCPTDPGRDLPSLYVVLLCLCVSVRLWPTLSVGTCGPTSKTSQGS